MFLDSSPLLHPLPSSVTVTLDDGRQVRLRLVPPDTGGPHDTDGRWFAVNATN